MVGTSGSGKTTLARDLARSLSAPHIELDALYWGPGWTPRPGEDFLADVRASVTADLWVIDGNYTAAGAADLVREHADTLVWLDLPRTVVMRQVVTRTLGRVITRAELWSGNREPWRSLVATDSVIRWAWTTYDRKREKYAAMQHDPAFAGLRFVRLRSRGEARRFVASLTP